MDGIPFPERIFEKFSQVQDLDLSNSLWQKYKQDFLDYFNQPTQYPDIADEFRSLIFYPCLNDNTISTPLDKHYFYQDTWASKKVFQQNPKSVLDIGSTILYVGIISQFVSTTFVDIRPVELNLPGLKVVDASVLNLPFPDFSQDFITSLCVLEHIGLGRYGDPILPAGTKLACSEINRVLKIGGELVVSVPVGKRNCIAFNAHRIFAKETFLSYFSNYELLDEIYLNPEPTSSEYIQYLDVGEFVVWVGHLKKLN